MHCPQSPQPHLYPATPTPEPEGGATVVFRDLPEAITYGANDEEVRAMAAEVLELAVAERMDRGRQFQRPAPPSPATFLLGCARCWPPRPPCTVRCGKARSANRSWPGGSRWTKPWSAACSSLGEQRESTISQRRLQRWA